LATTNPHIIRNWWRRWHWADVGWAIPAQTVCVDLDVKHGQDGIADFKKIDGRDPFEVQTPIARTSSGGLHLFFGVEPGSVKNADLRKQHDLSIDIKAGAFEDGRVKVGQGQVVLPTPLNGRAWIKSPLQVSKEQAPRWVLEWARPSALALVAPRKVMAEHTRFGAIELERLCWKIVSAQRGERDNTVAQFGFIIGQYVAGGEMEEIDAREALREAVYAQDAAGQPFSKASFLKRAMARFDDGMGRPRSRNTDLGLDAEAAFDAALAREMEKDRD
jgi:hypothetical protein